MNTSSRALMLAFGLALAMLAVSTLVAAIALSGEAASARQQAEVWKAYASSLHRHEPRLASGSAPHSSHGEAARRLALAEDLEDNAHQSPGLRF